MVEETSQIVDLRTLGALVNERHASPNPIPTPGTAMPAFGGTSLVALPAIPTPTPGYAPPPEPWVGRRARFELISLYLLLVSLGIAVLGLSGYLILRGRPVVVVERPPPSVAQVAAVEPTDDDDDEGRVDQADENEADPEPVREPRAPLLIARAEPESTRRTPPWSGGRRGPGRKTPPRPVAKPKPAPEKKADVSVECILDPHQCARPKDPNIAAPDREPSAEKLPAKLSAIQLKHGLAKAKTVAKACGPKHGAGGTRVKAKISVSGSTGRVGSVKIAGPHAGTAVGRCVSEALKRASFPRFSAKAIGFEYTVRL